MLRFTPGQRLALPACATGPGELVEVSLSLVTGRPGPSADGSTIHLVFEPEQSSDTGKATYGQTVDSEATPQPVYKWMLNGLVGQLWVPMSGRLYIDGGTGDPSTVWAVRWRRSRNRVRPTDVLYRWSQYDIPLNTDIAIPFAAKRIWTNETPVTLTFRPPSAGVNVQEVITAPGQYAMVPGGYSIVRTSVNLKALHFVIDF